MCGQCPVDRFPEACRVPGPNQEVEVERGMEFIGPQVLGETVGVRQPDLANEDAVVRVRIGDGPPAAVDLVELVAISVGVLAGLGLGRDLRECGVLDQQSGRIDPDAGNAAVEPELEDSLVLGTDVGVVPVQVGLFGREKVEIPLARSPVGVLRPSPGRAGEVGRPAVRNLAAVLAPTRVEPEPCAFWRPGRGCECRLEPGVLVGNMVGDDVDDSPDAQGSSFDYQPLRFVERSECGIDSSVVGDVVSAVGQGRDIPGREPDRVDA